MQRARLAPFSGFAVVALLVAACGGAGSTSPSASVEPSAGASTDASSAATRIEVSLTDALKIEPDAMTVPAGQAVTFVVTNKGTTLHEFVLGDEQEQMAHEKEMASEGGMQMPKDEEMAIGVDPGMTKELTVTFDQPGTTLAGCHVTGHYDAGMKATIAIE